MAQVNINDVARQAGVSIMTVSRALNNTGRISPETRERILKIATEMGYVADPRARSLRTGKIGLLGLVMPSFASPLINALAVAVAEDAERQGHELLMHTFTRKTPAEDAQRVRVLLGGLTDGAIIGHPAQDPEFQQVLEQCGVPLVLVSHEQYQTSLPTVRVHNQRAAQEATRHLLALGHRQIAFLEGTASSGQSHLRKQGFLQAMQEARAEVHPQWLVPAHFTRDGGKQAMKHLLQSQVRPTAVFAANDLSALGAMDALAEAGLRVPEDVSVLGFDDIPEARHGALPLTTVHYPVREVAGSALELLVLQLQNQQVSDVQVECALVVRQTTSKAP
ncbi:LacI family DNA-binding transcriptional regulator [Deinococcus misasensis]|uniref:LacI family DNA-binding transcriptional regulator n=1 Tax=Deinococcus misasensis TaxID=392413 RepID=UPI000B049AE5|nr:LacI family DNA-binding transcriptional regulator [Deinococcus misasensis]